MSGEIYSRLIDDSECLQDPNGLRSKLSLRLVLQYLSDSSWCDWIDMQNFEVSHSYFSELNNAAYLGTFWCFHLLKESDLMGSNEFFLFA